MLRRAVQHRSYDWESLLTPVLQSYRSSVSEATGFTPHRIAFRREIHLPVDLGSPLPEPPRDVRTFSAELAENLEWSYKVAREIIMHGHKRAESRYNERVVEHAYQPGWLLRVLQHARYRNAPSTLDTQYSGLCEVLEVRGALLTLRELDTRRVFTANHNAVRRSTMSRAAAPQVPAARAGPLPPVLRAAHPPPPLTPPLQAQVRPQPAQRGMPPALPAPPPVLPASPQPPLERISRQKYLQQHEDALAHCRIHVRRALFRSLARQLCCHLIRCTRSERVVMLAAVQRHPRRNRLFPSTQAPQIPSLIDLRVIAAPPLVQAKTPPPLHARSVPSLVLKPASNQQHLAPLRKKTRVAVHIVDGNA